MNTNLTKQLKNKDCGSKGYRASESFFFLLFGGAWYKGKKTNYKEHNNTSRAT
jgi:hypothetical protein